MAEYLIRWKQADYLTLGRAVSNFNKKIQKIKNEENKLYLPEEINYQELKGSIVTRRELNRQLNSLRRFLRQGAEELYTTEAGEQITKWEKKELSIETSIAKRRIQKQLAPFKIKDESGFSRAEMGSEYVRNLEAQLKNLGKLETKVGSDFKNLRLRIHKIGSSDYFTKRAITYRRNYINEMKKYSHLDNYNLLEKFFRKYSNPDAFYEKMKENERIVDLTWQSDNFLTQQGFNSFLQDLGIELEVDSV